MFDFLKLLAGDDDEEFSRMTPPPVPRRSMVEPAAWDSFWRAQFESGLAGFTDMLCTSGRLIDAMRLNRFRRVLCVGSGISREPRALAHAGFDVTVLDISPLAVRFVTETKGSRWVVDRILEGRTRRRGGKIRFVVGDLRDPSLCRGPYDVVLERRTLQLYSDEDRPAAMRALADRLGSTGIFFSHSHRNPRFRQGYPCDWFNDERWPHVRPDVKLTGRAAWLFSTSG